MVDDRNNSASDRVADLERQIEALQAQLLQSEKMAGLGQLLAGVAHEINTPLAALVSNNDLFIRSFVKLRAILTDPAMPESIRTHPNLQSLLEHIGGLNEINKTAAERIMNLVGTLRSFARTDKPEKVCVGIQEGIESSLTLVQHELKNRIKVKKEFASLPDVCCYPNQLNQVILNMLVNAAHAIEGEGTITVQTRTENGEVVISISDTGKGIPEDIRDRIFEPGFTTKGESKGTGLGLSIARRIMEEHGGSITFTSEVGRGTTFTIRLPAA